MTKGKSMLTISSVPSNTMFLAAFFVRSSFIPSSPVLSRPDSFDFHVVGAIPQEQVNQLIAGIIGFRRQFVQRFQRIQYWMQNHVDAWTDSSFNRSGLCEGVGYNRHLVLQSLRSQGFNNVHDYINSYRVTHLKRQIKRGKVSTLNDCLDSGFGTTKTARSCFARHEGISLDDYLALNSRGEVGS